MFFYEMLQEWNQGFDEPFGPKFGDITDSWSSSLRFVCLNRVLGIFKLWFLVQNWRGSRLNLQMEVENVYWRQFWWSSSSKLSKLDLASHTCRPALQIVRQLLTAALSIRRHLEQAPKLRCLSISSIDHFFLNVILITL